MPKNSISYFVHFPPLKPHLEVQLYVESFLSLKKLTHKTYEIERVDPKKYTPLLKPLFNNRSLEASRDVGVFSCEPIVAHLMVARGMGSQNGV